MFSTHSRAIALAFSLALLTMAPPTAALAQSDNDPVVATVNGGDIRLSDVSAFQRGLPDQYRNMPMATLFPMLVDRLIDLKLAANEARASGLRDDKEVIRRMAQAEDTVLREVYLGRAIAARLTDEALRKRYDAFLKDYAGKEEIRARHILVKTEDEAKAIIAELKSGADFAELAKAKSTGPSAAQGGDLDYFTRDAMVPEFADAAFALAPGTFTQTPVKTQFGWHVIKVEDRRTAPPPAFEDMRAQLGGQMTGDIVREIFAELRKGAKVTRFNIDGSPVAAPAQD